MRSAQVLVCQISRGKVSTKALLEHKACFKRDLTLEEEYLFLMSHFYQLKDCNQDIDVLEE